MASNIATNIVAFILVLGFLIFAHEAGHFFMAKLFRVRVLVFSFGFGRRLFGFQRGDTDYRVSLIPLGGYVRMAGDVPEENEEGEEREGREDEFLSRPKWQRFLILIAGPAINILIAIVFIAGLLMNGREVLRDSEPIVGTVLPGKPAEAAGLQTGDRITAIDGDSTDSWDDLRLAITMSPGKRVPVDYIRGGQARSTLMTPERVETEYGLAGVAGISPWMSTEIGRVFPDTAASAAGLREGDRIIAVDDQSVSQLSELQTLLDERREKSVRLLVERDGGEIPLTLRAMKDANEAYGFQPPTEIQKLPLGAAVNESLSQNWKMIRYTFAVLGRLFKAEGSMKDFSGPISIARISGDMLRTGFAAVIFLMATISLQLGVLNLLPIPVLDGGHIFILLFEGVAGKDLSINAKERLFRLGFAFLAVLMIVVLYNDVIQNIMLMRKG